MTGMMKMRGGLRLGGTKRVVAQVGQKRTEGMYDSLRLGDKAVWLRIHPNQEYEQLIYDRDSQAVVESTNIWYQTESHWISAMNFGKGGRVACTSGPFRDKPCEACQINDFYWSWVRREKERTGQEPKKGSPAGRSTSYTTSVVVVENIYAVPVLDKQGRVKKSQSGKPIHNDLPGPLVPREYRKQPKCFGKKYYLDFGYYHRNALLDINAKLRAVCASCAHRLTLVGTACPQCGDLVHTFDGDEVTDWNDMKDFLDTEDRVISCVGCGYEGLPEGIFTCSNPDCTDPREGNILCFELKLRLRKDDDKKTSLVLEDYRLPTEDDGINELLKSPLDIPTIKAPAALRDQDKKTLSELLSNWQALAEGEDPGVEYDDDLASDDIPY